MLVSATIPPQEATISNDKTLSWVYAEEFVSEDDVLLNARERADQFGCAAIDPGAGAVLRMLAAAIAARSVVEIGTGTGVASLWLLRGMAPDGVLTTIDAEVEHQRAAKIAFAEDGIKPTRARAISGQPFDVLPRLTDGAYDMVLVGTDAANYADYVEMGLTLLRPGGLLVVNDALWHDRVADPARRDETTTAIREMGRSLRTDERVTPAMLPVGNGLLVAVRN